MNWSELLFERPAHGPLRLRQRPQIWRYRNPTILSSQLTLACSSLPQRVYCADMESDVVQYCVYTGRHSRTLHINVDIKLSVQSEGKRFRHFRRVVDVYSSPIQRTPRRNIMGRFSLQVQFRSIALTQCSLLRVGTKVCTRFIVYFLPL